VENLEELIRHVARALVDDPGAVEVTSSEEDRTLVVELRVANADLGKVIGKQGRMARALRSILAASATKLGKHTHLEIL
jgi:predicted RNA-binding protein YlqC (UPF0109 family)